MRMPEATYRPDVDESAPIAFSIPNLRFFNSSGTVTPALMSPHALYEEDILNPLAGLIAIDTTLARLARIWGELGSYLDLRENWDSYDAPAPTREIIDFAKKFVAITSERGVLPQAVAASPDGGITLRYLRGREPIIVDFYNDGPSVLLREDDAGRSYAEDFDASDSEVRCDVAQRITDTESIAINIDYLRGSS